MTPLEGALVLVAGVAAGGINTVVGSGTLITFPTLLALGVPPVTANVSNSLGLVPGSVAGAVGYRRELAGQARRVRVLASASVIGGLAGAVLLLVLPDEAFTAIVPVLVGLGLVLVVAQPWLARRIARRSTVRPDLPAWLWPAVALTGVYGGYFGAAQGVLLMGVLGVGLAQGVQENNAVKNVLAAVVNGVAGLVFAVVADVDWLIVVLLGVGATVGGVVGARIGRRLPPTLLRAVIVIVGVVALVVFLG